MLDPHTRDHIKEKCVQYMATPKAFKSSCEMTKCMNQFKSQFKREKRAAYLARKKIDFHPHDSKWQLSSL